MEGRAYFEIGGVILLFLVFGVLGNKYIVIDSSTNVTGELIYNQTTSHVFAHMTDTPSINLTLSDTHYQIEDSFENDVLNGFSYSNSTWTYTNSQSAYFEIQHFMDLESDTNNNDVHVLIAINGVSQNFTDIGNFFKYATDIYPLGGNLVMELNQGDNISFNLVSDLSGTIMTFHHMLVTIKPFGGDNWKGLPINSTYDYSVSNQLETITDTFSNYVLVSNISYNDEGQINNVVINNPISGIDNISFTYNDSLLREVQYD